MILDLPASQSIRTLYAERREAVSVPVDSVLSFSKREGREWSRNSRELHAAERHVRKSCT